VRAGLARYLGKTAGFGDQAEQAELKRETFVYRRLRRRLPGLIVDDRQTAAAEPVNPVGLAVKRNSA
jgi:hypothetical protein